MTTANSPRYAAGQRDGQADADRIGHCPSLPPYGPCPPDPRYPHMYNRGYHDVFDAALPHICVEKCRQP
jgi:hypothetical protein